MRKKYATAYEKKGARLTVTSFVLKAVVAALKKHPIFNASLDEAAEEIVFKEYYHIGIAVDTEAGLIVPVIRDADKKDVLALSLELEKLAKKARDRKVSADELKGGTFTISNQGGIGGAHFTPIVNKPEVAILGLGRGALKPVVVKDKIEARTMLPLGLSYVIVSLTAARRRGSSWIWSRLCRISMRRRSKYDHPRPRSRPPPRNMSSSDQANGMIPERGSSEAAHSVMFDHEKLDVYRLELQFIAWVALLIEEASKTIVGRTGEISDQLDRASLSSLLNTAEGNGKRQRQVRAKFFDDARGSATECAACLDALVAKRIVTNDRIAEESAS